MLAIRDGADIRFREHHALGSAGAEAGTWNTPFEASVAKMMRPSLDHAPPRGYPAASQMGKGVPPARSTRCNLAPAKKPIDLLSGDQKGDMMSSPLTSKRAPVPPSGRTHSPVFPSPEATKAAVLPSGDKVIPLLRTPKMNRPPSGGLI
jgi:hypothetical protein